MNNNLFESKTFVKFKYLPRGTLYEVLYHNVKVKQEDGTWKKGAIYQSVDDGEAYVRPYEMFTLEKFEFYSVMTTTLDNVIALATEYSYTEYGITEKSTLDEMQFDELDLVEFVFELEEALEVDLYGELEDFIKVNTLEDIAKEIDKLI